MSKFFNKYLPFLIYLYLLVWVTIFKCGIPKEILGTGYSTNPIAFGPVTNEFMQLDINGRLLYTFNNPTSLDVLISSFILNVIVFIPFGIYLSIFKKKISYDQCFLYAFLISMIIELIQLFTAIGGFDFLDIMSNVFGAIIGVFIYNRLVKHYKFKSNEIINKVNKWVIIIFIPVCIFATIYTGINFKYIIFRLKHVKF